MKRFVSIALALSIVGAVACTSVTAQQATPPANYKKVSTLVALPDFVPGLGTLYVDPATLPAGPFLAYDKQGKLVSSVYMVGRTVVGRPSGPGGLPFDYFNGLPGTGGWKAVPDAARTAFPAVERIMQSRIVRRSQTRPAAGG
jgi:hypothetical protein